MTEAGICKKNMGKANSWVGLKVVTESGYTLGWVKKVTFNTDGRPFLLQLVASPFLWLPESITGLYELPAHEIAAPCTNRLIAFGQLERNIFCRRVGLLVRFSLSEVFEKVSNDGYILPCPSPDDPFDDQGPSFFPVPTKPGPSPLDSSAAVRLNE